MQVAIGTRKSTYGFTTRTLKTEKYFNVTIMWEFIYKN